MELISVRYWPFWASGLVMALAASVNVRTHAIPNKITLTFILLGWVLGLLHSLDLYTRGGEGGIAAAVICGFTAGLIFLAMYAAGYVGAGTAKLQIGFGAWVGAMYGLVPGIFMALATSMVAAILLGIHWAIVSQKTEENRLRSLPTAPAQFFGSVPCLVVMHFLFRS
jgi:Flp pilus assembly protein protease CpaA